MDDIQIGSEVQGTNGKLGTVDKVVVDTHSGTVTDLVVKHGFLFGNERVLPMGSVGRVEGNTVYTNLDEDSFKGLNGFTTERYRVPSVDDIRPAAFTTSGYVVDIGSPLGTNAVGYPGNPAPPPNATRSTERPFDQQRPAVGPGTPVLDSGGEKIGEVGTLSVAGDLPAPGHITVKWGLINRHEVALPEAWIADISDKGVMLNVPKEEVEQLAESVNAG